MGVKFEASDATRQWDKIRFIHVEILSQLSQNEIEKINKALDEIHNNAQIKEQGLTSEQLQEAEYLGSDAIDAIEAARDIKEEHEREEAERAEREEEKEDMENPLDLL